MRLIVTIFIACLLSVAIRGQITSGTIKSGSVVNAKQRQPNTFVDTFDRADANPMTTTASDGVGVWTDGPGSLDPCKILGNFLATSTGDDSGCRVLSPGFRANQAAEMIIGNVLAVGLMVRVQSPTDCSGYLMAVDDPTHISFYKVEDTGTLNFTQLGATETVPAIGSLETVTFSIVGSTMYVYVNGASLGITRTDSTFTSGQPGTYMFGFGGSIIGFSATEL